MTDEVLVDLADGIGTITLNRPGRINALTAGMVTRLTEVFEQWAGDDAVREIVLRGAGERGFCAGADVRALRDAVVAGETERMLDFLHDEYYLDGLIASYPKPVTAELVGIAMGGGLGLGMHGTHRIGEPGTRWAMPETAIGLWPDVGVCYELARTPGQTGAHLAMTGDSIDGASALWAGLLHECPGADAAGSALAGAAGWIDECYAGDDPVAIVARLAEHPDPDALAAAATIGERSPMSVAVALAAVRRAAQAPDVAAVLDQDRTLADTLAVDPSDFVEGVRAKMVDKDGAPRWRHASLEEVDPAEVAARFGD